MGILSNISMERDDIDGLDMININNISDLEFSKLIGEYGYLFVLKYINEAEVNEDYRRRIVNLKIAFPYNDLWSAKRDKERITRDFFETLFCFRHLNKEKLISVMGEEEFAYRFSNLIALDIIFATDEKGNLNLPSYVELIKNSDLLISCIDNIILNDSIFIKKIMNKAMDIWGYLFRESYLEGGHKTLFDKKTGKKLDRPSLDENGMFVDDDNIYALAPLTDIDMANIANMLKDFRDILHEHPLYPFFKYIAKTSEFFNSEYSLDVFFMDSTLNGIIYFYDPYDEDSNLRSQGWLLDYIFFYERDDRFPHYEDLFDYITEMVDMP
ncbi:MAG: hypothetical protein ACOCRK_01930 [bacterium]